MKSFILFILITLKLFGESDGTYIELGAGFGLDDKLNTKNTNYVYDKKYVANLALGYQLSQYRLELEARYKKDAINSIYNYNADGDITKQSQMINAYYSGYNDSKLVSSVGLGVGLTTINVKNLIESTSPFQDIENKNIRSYQAIFSIGYMISESFTLTTKYTYFYISESDDFKATSDNIFSLSLRYLF